MMLTAAAWHARLREIQAASKAAEEAGEPTAPFSAQVNALYRQQIPPTDLESFLRHRRIGSVVRASLRRKMDPGLSPEAEFGLTQTQINDSAGATVRLSEHVYDVAVERINQEAPEAPVSAQSEAMIRYAGYLIDTGVDATDPAGPDPSRAGVSAWFRSGAASVLAPYRPRRAV